MSERLIPNTNEKINSASKEEFSKQNKIVIVTKITQATKFYLAEDYHQKYIQKNYKK